MPSQVRSFGTIVSDATVGTVAWSNPGNAGASDDTDASANAGTDNVNTEYLKATNANPAFSIPEGVRIDKIIARIERAEDSIDFNVSDNIVKLVIGGAVVGNNMAKAGEWETTDTVATYDHTPGDWGVDPDPADINASDFGFVLSANIGNNNILGPEAFVDYVEMEIQYTEFPDESGISDVEILPLADEFKIFAEEGISDAEIQPFGVEQFVFVESGISDVEIVPSGVEQFVFVEIGTSDVLIEPLGTLAFSPARTWATRGLHPNDSLSEINTLVEITGNVKNLPSGSPSQVSYKGILKGHPEVNEQTTESIFGLRTKGNLDFQITNKYGDIEESDDLSGMHARVGRLQDGSWEQIYIGEVSKHDIGLSPTFSLHDLIKTVFHEKLGRVITTDLYPNAKDVGKRINIPFGRVARLECANIEWDDVNRIYRWALGEGKGHGGADWNEVTTAYKQDVAFKEVTGTVQASTANTITLDTADRRPDEFFKWFWVFISGQTPRFVTTSDDDGTNTILTVDSDFDSVPEAGVDTYVVREWRNYLDSNDIMILEFKKRFVNGSRILPIYADVDALQAEKNFVRLLQSVISNSVWGKGLSVNSSQFSAEASSSVMISHLAEGNILDETLIDVVSQITQVRGMELENTDAGIGLEVDKAKSSVGTFTLNNIIQGTFEPGIEMLESDRRVKDITAHYRWDWKEGDFLRKDLTRQANPSGESRDLPLKYVYSADTADRILDYWRKREKSKARFISFSGMKDFPLKKKDRFSLLIEVVEESQNRTLINSDWEVIDYTDDKQNHIVGKANRYIDKAYEASSSLPVEENLPVAPDFSDTPPDPLANFAVDFQLEIQEDGTNRVAAVFTFDPPEENYSETSILMRKSSATEFEEVGKGFDRARVASGFIEGEVYDFQGIPWNETQTKQGLASILSNQEAPGDSTKPKVPGNPSPGNCKFGIIEIIWDQVTQDINNNPLKNLWGYEWQERDSGNTTTLDRGFVEDLKKIFNFKDELDDLNTIITKYIRIRAITIPFFQSDGSRGLAGDWTDLVQCSTNDIKTGDIGQNQASLPGSFQNNADIETNSGVIASVTLDPKGEPVELWFDANVRNNNANESAGGEIRVRRGGVNQRVRAVPGGFTDNLDNAPESQIHYIDLTPPTGSTTYEIHYGGDLVIWFNRFLGQLNSRR